MSDYPTPDEEFELMYGDEFDLIRENDEEDFYEPPVKSTKSSAPSTHLSNKNAEQNFQVSESVYNNSPLLFSTQLPNETQNNDVLPLTTTSNNISQQIPHTILAENISQDTTTRKRNVDELFGDIGDLDIDDFEIESQPSKKTKPSKEDELRDLMEHIILLRKLNKEKSNILSVNKSVSTDNTARDKYNVSYTVPKYPFVGLKRFDGERVYVRFHSEEYEKEEVHKVVKESSGKDIFGENRRQIWDEARALISKQITNEIDDKDNEDIQIVDQSERNKQLWTDLYKPKKYVELLSDESTNRIILKWLKLWDKAVFNRRPRMKPAKPVEHNQYNKFTKFELNTELDEHGRPQYKVVLLCGPPGLGKTTLAHVAAKHAGYNVVEINASDDRSPEAFKTSLESATQMRSVVDREGRPNCLIFDEIDGAPQTSIDFLIKFINGTATTKSKKGKTQKDFILKRPIICICNDVYVPALRPLRQIAFVVNFPPTSNTRLAERLMCIARRELIKTDLGAMMALAEKSNNDIRSCLSVLYFFKAQNRAVTLSDVYRTNVGQKDVQKGLFAVWQEIFHIQRPNQNALVQEKDKVHKQTMNARMSKILQTVSAFGDYDRVAQGVYENFPLLKLKDTTIESLTRAMDWFVFSDIINKEIYSSQNYSLFSYLPYAFVVWHFLFATPQSQKLTYPNTGYEELQQILVNNVVELLEDDFLTPRTVLHHLRQYTFNLSDRQVLKIYRLFKEAARLLINMLEPDLTAPKRASAIDKATKMRQKQTRRTAIVSEVLRGMPPAIRTYCHRQSLILDILPLIIKIIVPHFRPVSLHLYTKDEKESMLRVVNSMIDYNLNYVQERLPDGTYVFNLEPNIEDLICVQNSASSKKENKSLSYSNRQLIAREIELEKMRRFEICKGGGTVENSKKNEKPLPNHLQTLKPKSVKPIKPIVAKDFFGRVVTKPTNTSKNIGPNLQNDIWYQYKEGYNNAVRKTIKMSDLY